MGGERETREWPTAYQRGCRPRGPRYSHPAGWILILGAPLVISAPAPSARNQKKEGVGGRGLLVERLVLISAAVPALPSVCAVAPALSSV